MYEHYDEVVFTNPSEEFAKLLALYKPPPCPPPHRLKVTESKLPPPLKHLQDFFTEFSDHEDMKQLTAINSFILGELDSMYH